MKNTHLDIVESCSSLALLFEDIFTKQKQQQTSLLIASHDNIQKLKSFLYFKQVTWPWYELPSFPQAKSPYSESLWIKRLRWQSWASQQNYKTPILFLSSPQALLKKTKAFASICMLKPGDLFDIKILKDYKQVSCIEHAGTYSSRGFLLDVFSPAYDQAIRFQLSEDRIQSMHLLSADFRRREKSLDQACISPLREWDLGGDNMQKLCRYLKTQEQDLQKKLTPDIFKSLARSEAYFGFENLLNCLSSHCSLDLFSKVPQIYLFDPRKTQQEFLKEQDHLEKEHAFFTKQNLFLPWDKIKSFASCEPKQNTANKTWQTLDKPLEIINISSSAYPDPFKSTATKLDVALHDVKTFSSKIFKKTKSLKEDLSQLPVSHIIFTGHKLKELKQLLFKEQVLTSENQEFFQDKNIIFLSDPIKESFTCQDHAYLRSEDFIKNKTSLNNFDFFRQKAQALEFSKLELGDLLVHRTHGVGEFAGLQTLTTMNKREDFIVLKYKDGDKLFIQAYKSSQIKKYSKKQASSLSKTLVDRLGNPKSWERRKSQAKKHIQSLAIELIELYRIRQQQKRPAFKPVTQALENFALEFPFKETKDQKQAIQDIMLDLSKDQPMDRLLAADTGFGKTEVALRACFRVLENNFQVCFLAPTTVLSLQHFKNFTQRFKNTKYKIALLNRFVSKKEKESIFLKAQQGELDFLIATHSIFSPHLSFKNLGLLILDEEHRFGVRQKESLFRFRKKLDILSLSATPIPRTLNMAMTGIKDISVIAKPPSNRRPVSMTVKAWNEDIESWLQQACQKEKSRNGQILFVHNRVKSLEQRSEQLQRLLPGFKLAVAHGKSKNLDQIILDFFNKKYDILLSTNIIESGMDIPQANTIFIDRVHEMGLSQIYQLKGRVGRGTEQAFCYLLFPDKDRLSSLAKERLELLKKYSGFGEGFQLALYDLENRGAGALFGSEQSGHLQGLGEEMYFELLNEELAQNKSHFIEPEILLPFATGIPQSYISESSLRLLYYKNLSTALTKDNRLAIKQELLEDFGSLPQELKNLFFLLDIRENCKKHFIKYVKASSLSISLVFHENSQISVEKLLEIVQSHNGQWLSDRSFKLTFKEADFFKTIETLFKNLS